MHTLIASSLGFLGEAITSNMVPGSTAYDNAVSATNAMFLNATNGGIAAPEATGSTTIVLASNLVLGLGTQLTGAAASAFTPSGSITIEAGASISTHANGTGSDGGFVLIAAPNVSNAGTITTTNGQTILAAGIGVSLLPSSTQLLVPELTGQINIGGVDKTPAGSLINTGLIQAETGNVTLLGTNITVGGVVGVTTSVSQPGSIIISTVDEAIAGGTDSKGDPTGDSASQPADRRAGQLIVSGLITNLQRELELAGVPVHRGSRVDRAKVVAEAPDVVLIATGARPYRPEFPQEGPLQILDAWQVLRGEGSPIGQSVVVIDWRADWIGIGIAEHLAQSGRSVRLAVCGTAAGDSLPLYVRDDAAGSLHKLGVKVLPYMRLYGSDSDSVYLQHICSGEAVVIDKVDTLVLCTGHSPVEELSDSLEDLGIDVHVIGDAASPRTAEEAIYEGLKVAAEI